ncbi:MAG: pyruvate kinase [Bacteroidales bacterium]|nr:pyruvate kinase [Bacteroidales bacterium]
MNKNKTKIVATIGPATSSKEILKELIITGVNVCRLNFSHGSHEDHLKVMELIREINSELKCNTAILADLQGPKLRIGEVENNGVLLNENHIIEFTNEKCLGNANRVYMSYSLFPRDVAVGDYILVDDGKIKLQATETNGIDMVKARVIHGGILSSKKGVNLPNTKISLPSMTEKDIADAHFALDHDVDWIALSFVRSAKDIIDLKDLIAHKGKHTMVIAKIEKPEAMDHIDEIIAVTDGIMVARGDLGVEMPFNQVPLMQKTIVEKCIKFAKPVIIATQMLESMITNSTPTRAEATDVANAVIDGASAVMLSGETGVGKYPIEVILAMKSIICYTEQFGYKYNRYHEPIVYDESFIPDSICLNAGKLSNQINAQAIIVLTYSGYTSFRIASHRLSSDVFAFTPNEMLLRQMSLLWGVKAYKSPEFFHTDDAIDFTLNILSKEQRIKKDDLVIHIGSTPLNKRCTTNMVKLTKL